MGLCGRLASGHLTPLYVWLAEVRWTTALFIHSLKLLFTFQLKKVVLTDFNTDGTDRQPLTPLLDVINLIRWTEHTLMKTISYFQLLVPENMCDRNVYAYLLYQEKSLNWINTVMEKCTNKCAWKIIKIKALKIIQFFNPSSAVHFCMICRMSQNVEYVNMYLRDFH